MAELESLATEEAFAQHLRRHAIDRLVMLSDGVFAIAVTLAALEIHVPVGDASLEALSEHLLRPVLAYIISFALCAVFWFHSRDLMARMEQVDSIFTVLMLASLCAVALVPVAAFAVYAPGMSAGPVHFYAALMAICGLVTCTTWAYGSFRPGLMRREVSRAYRWKRIVTIAMMPLLFTPIALLPIDLIIPVVMPMGLIATILRRTVLPRFLRTLDPVPVAS